MGLNRVVSKHCPPTTVFGRSKHVLVEPLEMLSHTVPIGFKSDGMTISPFLFIIAQSSGKLLEPAILHDYLLSKLGELDSRKQADIEFIDECERYGVDPVRKALIYNAVRTYGFLIILWRKYAITKQIR